MGRIVFIMNNKKALVSIIELRFTNIPNLRFRLESKQAFY